MKSNEGQVNSKPLEVQMSKKLNDAIELFVNSIVEEVKDQVKAQLGGALSGLLPAGVVPEIPQAAPVSTGGVEVENHTAVPRRRRRRSSAEVAAAPARQATGRPQTCIAPGCTNANKGPRFHYLCETHKGVAKPTYETWQKLRASGAVSARA